MTWNEGLTLFQISRQTLSKWLKMEENGNLSDPPRREDKTRKIEVTKLKKWVESQPDFTLAEDAEPFHCRPQAVANRLKQLRITRKKTTPRDQERDEEPRQEDLNQLQLLERERVVYVDESGIEETIHRQDARSERGQPVFAQVKGKTARRVNLIAGWLQKKLLAPGVFNRYIDSSGFNFWLEHHLLPQLSSPGYTIMVDHARFHQSPQTRELVAKAQCQLVFWPPYSPDLNPIENWWAIIKTKLKALLPQFEDFNQALDYLLTVYL